MKFGGRGLWDRYIPTWGPSAGGSRAGGIWGHLPTVAHGAGSPGWYGASLHVGVQHPDMVCDTGVLLLRTSVGGYQGHEDQHRAPHPPSPVVPRPFMLQEEARHTAIKNITSVLFGICYSARVTGYKYILQRASSPSALRGAGAGAGCGAVVVLAPGSRASRAIDALAPGSRASRHRCVTAASTGSVCQPDRLAQGQDMVSPQGPVPFSCLPRPQVLVLTLGG